MTLVPEAARTVMVVEDDCLMRRLMHDVLVELGFQVHMARDSAEALDALERTTVDLVLTDWDLPYLDGLMLCRVLRSRPATRAIPIVLMSGVLDEAALESSFVSAFLAKPFSITALQTTVEQVLQVA